MARGSASVRDDLEHLEAEDRVFTYYDRTDDCWHERVLLAHVREATWIILTPDFDCYEEDLGYNLGVALPGPRGGLPPALRQCQVHRFREAALARRLPQALVDARRFAARGRRRAGDEPAPEAVVSAVDASEEPAIDEPEGDHPDGSIWVAAEARYGFSVGAPLPRAAVPLREHILGDRAVVAVPGGQLAVALLGTLGARGAGEGGAAAVAHEVPDLRVLPVAYAADGRRFRDFPAAVDQCTETPFGGWKVDGPRTLRWLAQQFVAQNTTPTRRHFWWRQVLGLAGGDPGVDEHLFLSELLEDGLCFDQLNCSELVVFEQVARRFQLWEESYASALREAEAGAGAGGWLDERHIFLGHQRSRGHALVAPTLEEWVAERLQKEAGVLKERRKNREERLLAQGVDQGATAGAAATGAPGGGGDGKRARGRGRG